MKEDNQAPEKIYVPGTLVLVFIFLAWFITLYIGNWVVLSKLWPVQ